MVKSGGCGGGCKVERRRDLGGLGLEWREKESKICRFDQTTL